MKPGREPLPVGRQLDALVADKVFGLVPCTHPNCPGKPWCYAKPQSQDKGSEVPMYSEDIAAAWEVVEKLEDEFEFALWGPHRRLNADDWECQWTNKVTRAWYSERAYPAPHAICLAALKAVGVLSDTP